MIHERDEGAAHLALDDIEGTPYTVTVTGPDGLTRTETFEVRPDSHRLFDKLNTEAKALAWARSEEVD